MSAAIIDLPYLPDISWFVHFVKYGLILIEREENFLKSTRRNRCEIAGPQGKQLLSIPLAGGRGHHQKYRETKIDYSGNWQSNHWHSISAAYGSTPFFEYYAPQLQPFYERRTEMLFEFNLSLLKTVLAILKIKKEIKFNSEYEKVPGGITDLRSTRNNHYAIEPLPRYYQVFEDRNGFIANLSIIDLLFHCGPQSMEYLRQVS